MVNSTVPAIPNRDADVLTTAVNQPSSGSGAISTPAGAYRLVQQWYLFFNSVRQFLVAVRNAPQVVNQPDLDAMARKLTQRNAGIQVWVPAPYNHLLRWSGTAWAFWPGDASAYYVDGLVTPPAADGWHLADGSKVTYLKGDGTTAQQTLPTVANRWFRL